MSFNAFGTGGGGGAAVNQTLTYDPIGFGTNGAGTTITAGSSNTKGSGTSLGTTGGTAWIGFFLCMSGVNNASTRFMIDIGSDNTWAGSIKLNNAWFAPALTTGGYVSPFIPLIMPASTQFYARCQASAGSATMKIALIGVVGSSDDPPGYSTCTTLLADTTNTRVGSVDVPTVNDAGAAWTTLVASTAATYGAIIPVVGYNGTAPATAQTVTCMVGDDSTEVSRFLTQTIASGSVGVANGWGPLIHQSIASGSVLQGQMRAAATGENLRMGFLAFS